MKAMNEIQIRKVDSKFYVFREIHTTDGLIQVKSISGSWYCNGNTDSAVKYVGTAYSSKSSAMRKVKTLTA